MNTLPPLAATGWRLCLGLPVALAVLVLASCTTTDAPSSAAKPTPAAAPSKPLRVGINPTMAPIAFKEDGELKGIEPDLARGLAQHLGRRLQFVELPWVELIPALQRGRIDIIMSGMSITPQRQALVEFAPPYLSTGLVALLRRDQEGALGYFFNEKVKIGVKPGTTGEFYVQQEHSRNPVTRYTQPEAAAEAIIKGKIEIFFVDALTAWRLAGQYEAAGLTATTSLLTTESLAWAVRKDDSALLAAVTQYHQLIRENGEKTLLMRRWMGMNYRPAE